MVSCPRALAAYASSECPPLSSSSLRVSCGVMSATNRAPAASHAGRPAGKSPLSTHSVNGSVTTGTASSQPVCCGHRPHVVGGGPRGDPVDHGGHERHLAAIQSSSAGSAALGQVVHHAGGHLAVARQVVAGHHGQRAGAGRTPRGQAGDQPAGHGGRAASGRAVRRCRRGRLDRPGRDRRRGRWRYAASVTVSVTTATSRPGQVPAPGVQVGARDGRPTTARLHGHLVAVRPAGRPACTGRPARTVGRPARGIGR